MSESRDVKPPPAPERVYGVGRKLIGKDYPTPDLYAKVTGQAKYAEDYHAEGMLFCKLLLSPVPHGRVTASRRARGACDAGCKSNSHGATSCPRRATA